MGLCCGQLFVHEAVVDAAPIVTAILYPYLQEAASANKTVAFMMKHYASSNRNGPS